jgi:hypothetical protein
MEFQGTVSYLYLYDIGDEVDVSALEKAKPQTEFETIAFGRVHPKYISIRPAPILMRFEPMVMKVFGVEALIEVTARIYAVGAVSVTLKVPVKGTLEDLIKYNSLQFVEDGVRKDAQSICRNILDGIIPGIEPFVEDLNVSKEPEEYTTFSLKPVSGAVDVKAFIQEHQAGLASMLRGESLVQALSEEEMAAALRARISYYSDDLVAVDWSTAVIIDPREEFSDIHMLIELGNLQLLEMRVYDNILDKVIAEAEDELQKFKGGFSSFLRNPNKEARKVAQKRMEVNGVIDSTKNYTKFIGEWYQARVYSLIADKLRLKDWDDTLSDKLETLDKIYGVVAGQNSESRTFTLEVIMLVIIVVEILIFVPGWFWSMLTNLRLP